jgi:hypothetical protein
LCTKFQRRDLRETLRAPEARYQFTNELPPGGQMKRKGNRDIPDFSKKRAPTPNAPDAKAKAAAPPPPVRGKPQSKSAKSGQRGR